MKKTIKEGPEWGPESAAAYKADTPGQEGADNVPYKSEDNIVNDDIKKMIEIVSKKIMGLKEHIVRHYSQWSIIESYLDQYGTQGIDKLVEDATMKSVAGKPLRSVVEESKWNYPKNMTKTKETSDMGTTNAAQNRKDRKTFRKNLKAVAHKKLMTKVNESKINPDELMDDKGVVRKLIDETKKLTPWQDIQEISDKKGEEYRKKAVKFINDKSNADGPIDYKGIHKRHRGLSANFRRKMKKKVNEENIQEISDTKAHDYENKAKANLAKKELAGGPKDHKTIGKRYKGLSAAMRRKDRKEKTGDRGQDDYNSANRSGNKAGTTRHVGD